MHGSLDLYDTRAAKAIDARATAILGGDAMVLMERAGAACWRFLQPTWPHARSIVVACGPGNNGGDGYVLARLARQAGCEVYLVHAGGHEPRTGQARRARAGFEDAGGAAHLFDGALPHAQVIVDAIFGIGLARAPDGVVTGLMAAMDAHDAPVFALDVPSGVAADTGAAPGLVVSAHATLQLITRHVGLYTGDGLQHAGLLSIDTLDVPSEAFEGVPACAQLATAEVLAHALQPRRRNTHKGESGRVLCIGGDLGHGGAIVLCAEAALRSGAGLVSVATREAHVAVVLGHRPEAMARAVESGSDLQPLLAQADSIALGPGLGQGEWGRAMFQLALAAGKPLVIDADALNLLAQAPRELAGAVLTPHPGEAARLLGTDIGAVQGDRLAAARTLATRHAAVVVLKGAGTVVVAPDSLPCIIGAGNPGMATGGMGDVLTGVVAALIGQGHAVFEAAVLGALLHSLAADEAAAQGQRGLLPSDLWPHLRRLCNPGLPR